MRIDEQSAARMVSRELAIANWKADVVTQLFLTFRRKELTSDFTLLRTRYSFLVSSKYISQNWLLLMKCVVRFPNIEITLARVYKNTYQCRAELGCSQPYLP
ncbi:hypothetical protein [Collimonas sp. PA-H2]|uniref:hypothetical protein n=1 Tax=Collimonas sp. PA-H2 TaxID=1881062 RepID=UPI00117BF436|nr:hypothetical protein [Collimonas sp. PA-H2]